MDPMLMLVALLVVAGGVFFYLHTKAVSTTATATATHVLAAVQGTPLPATGTASAVPASPSAADVAAEVVKQTAAAQVAQQAATVAMLTAPQTTVVNGQTVSAVQYAAMNTPQAAGFKVVQPVGAAVQPSDYASLDSVTVVAIPGSSSYMDNTGNVVHFSVQKDGTTAKVGGY
jgi:hypothetical protein